MNFVVPHPVPLDPPRGNVGALEELVEDVGGTAYWLTVLSTNLAGPAASAPGWLGRDASAAAVEVGAVARVARECSAAVGAAEQRLRLHHDLLREAVRRVAALEAEQEEDFSEVRRRLARIQYIQATELDNAPEGEALIADLRAAEAVRRRRHAALLDEVADDAAATIRVLAEASSVVGGRGTRGDGNEALAYLAAELPGWGDAELRRRGSALARELGSGGSEHREALAREALAYAGSAAFARGLLAGLGVGGVHLLLESVGYDMRGPDSDVARVLAAAFGAARPDGRADEPLRKVLTATYVVPGDGDTDSDVVAAGLAAVLLAGITSGASGVRPETAARWARQMLAREREQGVFAGAGAVPHTWDSRAFDPAALAFAVVADGGEPGPAAELLADREIWDTVLARFWGDGGESLRSVLALASAETGPNGDATVRAGLEALGAGLADGDPDGWTVSRGTAAAVAPALGAAVAQHVTVATDVLALGVDGELDGRAGDTLRGLGYLTLDEGAARTIGAALQNWVRVQPVPVEVTCAPLPPPAVVIPSAFLAVREYGQRLDYALHGFEEKAHAESKAVGWDWTVGLAFQVRKLAPVAGFGLGVVEGYAEMALGYDGRWDNGRDNGMHFDGNDAAAAVLGEVPVDPAIGAVFAGQARTVFDRTAEALGRPTPPEPPEFDALGPVKDAAVEAFLGEAVERGWKKGKGMLVG